MKILHVFVISIMISGSLYPVFALDTPQVCDANSLPHYGPHNPSHIYIKDTSGNLPYIPLTDHTAILHDDDVWNIYHEPKTIQVTLTIHNQDTGQLVFNQTQSLQMQACSGPESVKWRFVPIQVANYIATISDNRDKENMIFNSMLDATKSQTVSSPLEQLRFGIDSHSIVCKQDLQLVIKSKDGSPVCVKPEHVTRLIQNGWTLSNPFNRIADTDILSAKTYNLKQVHYYGSSNLNPRVSLYDYSYDRIDKDGLVSINNQTFYQTTLNNDIYKLKDMSMQFHNVTFSFPEGTLVTPGGAFVNLDVKFKDGLEEIYGGTTSNSDGSGSVGGIPIPTQYGPHLSTTSITVLGNHTNPQAGLTIYKDKIKLLVSDDNQTSQTIPQCVSSIQNQYAVAGPRGDPLCPVVNFQASGKIVNYTGFYGVYGYSEYLGTPNFVLEPGHNGTLSYEIDIGSIYNWGNEPPTNKVNITNDIEFMHDAGMNNHPGVTTSVDSKSEIIQKNGSAFVTITFAATSDARPGTYWVDLPPSFCAGGKVIILTITNCEK